MSKFIDAIRYKLTGNAYRVLTPTPVMASSLESSITEITIPYDLPEYIFQVGWVKRVVCSARERDAMLGNIIEELRKDVYGDLETMLIRLERAIFEQKREEQLSAIRDIRSEIRG